MTVWLVTAPPLAFTDTQSQPTAVPMYSPFGVAPGSGTVRAEPLANQFVLMLFVTSPYFGLFLLVETKLPWALNCNRNGVPVGSGVGIVTIESAGIGTHAGVGVGLVLGFPFDGVGVGVGVGGGPGHITTLTSESGMGVDIGGPLLKPLPQLKTNAAAMKHSTGINIRDLRHQIIAH